MPARRDICCILATLLATFAGAAARAATIGLQPSAPIVAAGSLVNIEIYGTDFPLGADGGDLSLGWSPNLEYLGIAIADPPWDVSAWDDSTAASGYLGFVDVFSTTDTPGAGGVPFLIATLTLRGVSEGPATVSVGFAQVGWSLGGAALGVSYGPEAQLEVVPAPEPGTLPLAALLCAALWARREIIAR